MVTQGTVVPEVGTSVVEVPGTGVSSPARPAVSTLEDDTQTEAEPAGGAADVAVQLVTPVAVPVATAAPVAVVAKTQPVVTGLGAARTVHGHGSDRDNAAAAAPVPVVSVAAGPTQAAVAISAQGATAASAGSSAPVSGEGAKPAMTGGSTTHGEAPVHISDAIPEASDNAAQPAADAPATPSVQTEAEAPVIQIKVRRQDDQTSPAPVETVSVPNAGGSAVPSVTVTAASDRSATARNSDGQGATAAPVRDAGPVSDPEASVAVTDDASAVVPTAQALPVAQSTADPVTVAPMTASPVTTPTLPMPELASTAGVAATHVSAAGQIGPALLTLGTASDGTQQMTLRLQPEEMGTVQVRIDRAPDGTSQVNITADNPATLQLITSEQSDLHKALDAAGISATGRTVTFGLTSEGSASGTGSVNPTGITANQTREDTSSGQQSMGGGAMSQGSGGGSGGASRQDGDGGRPAYQPAFELAAGTFSESMDPDTDISE
jgi:flagellar hook-length control protein FliK